MNNLIFEMKKRPWNSILQLGIGGLMIFLIAFIAGPYYGCGGGNVNLSQGVFSCVDGSTTTLASKALIIFCIAISSLCWGRAVSLYEQGGGRVGNK